MKIFVYAACLLAMVVACGCETPSQIVWSPDGKLAAWRRDAKLWVIDENGAVIRSFDHKTPGGFAWSADSKTLYIAAERPSTEARADFHVRHDWMESPTGSPATEPTSPELNGVNELAVYASTGGETPPTPLFDFRADNVWHMLLSPDQNWLAVVAWEEKPEHFEIYVYSLASRKLYPLAPASRLGICFTGPARLAYIALDDPASQTVQQTGKLVEVTLDESARALERTALLEVLPGNTPWLASVNENIFFTARPRTFPGTPLPSNDPYHLFHFSRADGALTSIAQDAGPIFLPSPDGKRILYQKTTPATASSPDRSELAVISANGSGAHVLYDMTEIGLPLWADWRGNDEITFVSEPDQATPATQQSDQNRRTMVLDLVQYQLTPDGKLEALRTLSNDWPEEMKPYFRTGNFPTPPATTPSP